MRVDGRELSPEALSTGVIAGTTLPWEVTPAYKIAELVKNHTTFAGATGLYTQTFAFSMNRNAYDRLPADLKKVIDDNSGPEFSALLAKASDDGDILGRALAVKAGNKITELDVAEVQRWRRTASLLS